VGRLRRTHTPRTFVGVRPAGVQPHASVAPERPGCMLALGSSDTFKRPAVLTGGPSHAALRTLCV